MPRAVSIITVYYNAPDDLRNLYDSMQRQLPSVRYEFIVADNHSEKDLSQELPGVKYLRLPENYGFAKANNIASQKARGEFLFFVNPDCIFIEDCLTPLLSVAKQTAIVAPKVLNPDQSIQVSFGPTLSLWNEFRQRRLVKREATPRVQRWLKTQTSRPFSPDFVGGAALFIASAVFKELDRFDEKFFLYEEDVDLCERARKLGHKILYFPSARIVHVRGTSASRNSTQVNKHYRQSHIYFYQKYRGGLQTFLLRIYLTFKFLFK